MAAEDYTDGWFEEPEDIIERYKQMDQRKLELNTLSDKDFLTLYTTHPQKDLFNGLVSSNRFPALDIANRIQASHGYITTKQRNALTNVLVTVEAIT